MCMLPSRCEIHPTYCADVGTYRYLANKSSSYSLPKLLLKVEE